MPGGVGVDLKGVGRVAAVLGFLWLLPSPIPRMATLPGPAEPG